MTNNLLDRLFYKTVVGKITEREWGYRGLFNMAVTMYTVTTEKGKEVLAARDGHQFDLSIEDLVELQIERGSNPLVIRKVPTTEVGKDGRVNTYTAETSWAPISSYKLLSHPEEKPQDAPTQDTMLD